RGYRIELGEIEERIAEFPGIAEVVVMAREDRADDVRLVAYLRLSGHGIDEEALRRSLAKNLPDYMVPAHFVTLAAFPLTPNAKVDRKALPRPDTVSAQAAPVYVEPTDNVQREIAETFRRILGVEKVGLSDSFFALGGHSLLAVQAHRELKAGVAPDLLITDLFRFPT
ncbi:phosphopantetheine-binding protein, partial [Rhizobiaceae sp. 2RAB30]